MTKQILLIGLIAALTPAAWAYDSRFGIDPNVSVAQLEAAHSTSTSSGRNGDLYWADASAVLNVDAAKLFAAALDYDDYVAFGMPHLNESHVVERDSPTYLFTWASMSIATLHSQHYFEVTVHPALAAAGSQGMEWQLTPKRPSWPYTEASAFTQSNGSFYIEPLADGAVYVRYYLSNDVNIPLSGLLGGLIQSQLRKGAADVIMALVHQAPVSR